jgi:hypothetical protein
MIGVKPLSQSAIDAGEQITITEGGKTLNFTTREGETVEQTLNRLGDAIKGSGLALELLRPDPTTMDEMMQFTRNQIMTQSSIAMLAQANQAPTEVMNLIG